MIYRPQKHSQSQKF